MNLCLVGAASLALWPVAPPAALAAAAVGTAAVWLRGYVVPYTPRFAPRLAARLPWNPFHAGEVPDATSGASLADAGPADARSGETDDTGPADGEASGTDGESPPATDGEAPAADGEAVLEALVAAGIVRAGGERVELDEPFERRWAAERERLAALSADELAEATRAAARGDPEASVVTDRGRTHVVLGGDSADPADEVWLRRPVAVAETAAARALAAAALDADRVPDCADALLVFLSTCPVCGADLVERPAGDCCGPPVTGADGKPLEALVCEDCRVQFATFD